jgi:putative redox protein
MVQVEIERIDDAFAFKAVDSTGNALQMDAAVDIGGNNKGVRPMQMLLMSLGGCSGIDIVSILKKQRQTIEDFKISIQGEREYGKEPTLWKKIHVLFTLKGVIDEEKAKKACSLSIDKYCSVAATLRAAGCEIEWNVNIINGQSLN